MGDLNIGDIFTDRIIVGNELAAIIITKKNLFVKGNNIFNIEGDVCINGIPIKSTLGYLIKKEFKELLNEHLVKDITKIVLNYLGNVLN